MKSPLQFLFLEGIAGTGKTSICKGLSRSGYTVQLETFVQLCEQNPLFRPSGAMLSILWVTQMFKSLQRYTDQYDREPRQFKDDVVVFDRSLLTTWVYNRGSRNYEYALDAMKELQEVYNCRLVLCEAPVDVVRARLHDRYQRAKTPEEREIRIRLGELDPQFIARVDGRYTQLKTDGWFDHVLDTSQRFEQTMHTLTHQFIQKPNQQQQQQPETT